MQEIVAALYEVIRSADKMSHALNCDRRGTLHIRSESCTALSNGTRLRRLVIQMVQDSGVFFSTDFLQ